MGDADTGVSADSSYVHWAMRYGALDLMRCTEQTAILMAQAEGRSIVKESVAEFGALSMAGWIAGSPYVPVINVYDTIYESKDPSKPVPGPRTLWDTLVDTDKSTLGISAGHLSTPLEFCFTPVDGKRALSDGRVGGSLSCLAFASAEDPASPAFAPPEPKFDRRHRKPGPKSEAHMSPPYLMICLCKDFLKRYAGQEEVVGSLKRAAAKHKGREVEDFIDYLLSESPRVDRPDRLPLKRTLALLDGPKWTQGAWNRNRVPAGRKRVFGGSSIGLSLAALFSRKGYDCSAAIARHQHLIPSSIAAQVLEGLLVAFPLTPSHETSQGRGVNALTVEGSVLTGNDLVRTDRAAMILSGISEHVALAPVTHNQNSARVNTLYLNTFTGSVRNLRHDVQLRGEGTSEFTAYDASVFEMIKNGEPLPKPRTRPAGEWVEEFAAEFRKM